MQSAIRDFAHGFSFQAALDPGRLQYPGQLDRCPVAHGGSCDFETMDSRILTWNTSVDISPACTCMGIPTRRTWAPGRSRARRIGAVYCHGEPKRLRSSEKPIFLTKSVSVGLDLDRTSWRRKPVLRDPSSDQLALANRALRPTRDPLHQHHQPLQLVGHSLLPHSRHQRRSLPRNPSRSSSHHALRTPLDRQPAMVRRGLLEIPRAMVSHWPAIHHPRALR